MEWDDDLCLKLIRLYRDNPILWDPNNINYKLSKKKIDIWQNISVELGFDVTAVKKKIESLLTSYRRELRREGTTYSGMGTESVYHSKWFAFKEMQFLNDKFRPRKTQNTINIIDPAIADEDDVESQILNTSQEREEIEDDESRIDQDGSTPIAVRNKTNEPSVKPAALPKVAGKKRESEDPRVQAAFALIQSIGEKRSKKNEEAKSESALYGEYIGSQLEKFDDHTRAVVKHEFANILFQAEMGRYKLQPSPQWSISSTPTYASQPTPSPDICYGGQYQNKPQYFNNWAPAPPLSVRTPSPSPILPALNVLSQNDEGETRETTGNDYLSNM